MQIRALLVSTVLLPAAFALAEPPSDGSLLSGPKVEEDASKPTGERMTKAGQRENVRRQQIPPQQWFGLLRGLNLSQEQQTKIREIMNEFTADQKRFADSRSDEEREAFRKVREARAAGQEPPRELREMMQKIESQRPEPQPYQRRVWAVLTPEQQEQFKSKLDELRETAIKRQQEGAGNKKDGPSAPPPAASQPPENKPPAKPEATKDSNGGKQAKRQPGNAKSGTNNKKKGAGGVRKPGR